MAYRPPYFNDPKRPRMSGEMPGSPPHRRSFPGENYFHEGRPQDRGPPLHPEEEGGFGRRSWEPRPDGPGQPLRGEPRMDPRGDPRGDPRHARGWEAPPEQDNRFDPRMDPMSDPRGFPRGPPGRMDPRIQAGRPDPRIHGRPDPRGEPIHGRPDPRGEPLHDHRQLKRPHPEDSAIGRFDPRSRFPLDNPGEPELPKSRVEWGRDCIKLNVQGLQKSLGILWDDWEMHRDRCEKSQEDFIKHLLGLHKYNCVLKQESVSQGTQTDGEGNLTSKIHHLTGIDVGNASNLTVPLQLPNLNKKKRDEEKSKEEKKELKVYKKFPDFSAHIRPPPQVKSEEDEEGSGAGLTEKPKVKYEPVVLPTLNTVKSVKLPRAKGIPMTDLILVTDPTLPGAMIRDDGAIVIKKDSRHLHRQKEDDSKANEPSYPITVKERISGKVVVTLEKKTQPAVIRTHFHHIAQSEECIGIVAETIKTASVKDITEIFNNLRNHVLDVIATESGATAMALLYRYLAGDQRKFFIRGLVLKLGKVIIYKSGIQLLLLLIEPLLEQQELLLTTVASIRSQMCSSSAIIQLTVNIYVRVKNHGHKLFDEIVCQGMSSIIEKADEGVLKMLIMYYRDTGISCQQILQNITHHLATFLSYTHGFKILRLLLSIHTDLKDHIYLMSELLLIYKRSNDNTILNSRTMVSLFEVLSEHNRMHVALLFDDQACAQVVNRLDWPVMQCLFDDSYNMEKTAPVFDCLLSQKKCLLRLMISPEGVNFILFMTERHKCHLVTQFMHDIGALTMKMATDSAAIKILRQLLFESKSNKFRDILLNGLMEHLPKLISLNNGNWLLRECINMPYSKSDEIICHHIMELNEKNMRMMIGHQYGSMFFTEYWIHASGVPHIRRDLEPKLKQFLPMMKENSYCLELYLQLCDQKEFYSHAVANLTCIAVNKSLRSMLLIKLDQASILELDTLVLGVKNLDARNLEILLKADGWGKDFIIKLMSKVSLDSYAALQQYLRGHAAMISRIPQCSQISQLLLVSLSN